MKGPSFGETAREDPKLAEHGPRKKASPDPPGLACPYDAVPTQRKPPLREPARPCRREKAFQHIAVFPLRRKPYVPLKARPCGFTRRPNHPFSDHPALSGWRRSGTPLDPPVSKGYLALRRCLAASYPSTLTLLMPMMLPLFSATGASLLLPARRTPVSLFTRQNGSHPVRAGGLRACGPCEALVSKNGAAGGRA